MTDDTTEPTRQQDGALSRRRFLAMTGAATGATAGMTWHLPDEVTAESAHTYRVVQNGLAPEQFETLVEVFEERFGARPELFEYDEGLVTYLDERNYMRVPREEVPAEELDLPEPEEGEQRDTYLSVDVEAFAELPDPPEPDRAIEAFRESLAEADLEPERLFQGEAAELADVSYSASPTLFELRETDGSLRESQALDTTVSVTTTLEGAELVDSGSKIHATFATVDGEVRLTELRYAHPTVELGEEVDLASPRDLAPVERYEQELPWSVERPKLEARRVYRTPSPGRDNDNPLGDGEFEPGRLVPFYQYSGSVETGTEGGRVDLIGTHVPAVTDPELVPEIEIDATVEDGTVRARAAVEGGQPPYKLEWGAEAMATVPSTDDGEPAEISVELAPREPIEQTTVQASVVDANGATASATRTVEATVEGRQSSVGAPMGAVGGTAGGRALGASVADADPPSAATDSLRPGNFDFGFESANWNVSNDNGKGFVKQMRKGPLSERFTLWGRWCWERDYRDPPGPTAWDEDWGDNADFQYYVGHGNPKLFTFKDSSHEKGYFPYWNGDRDWGDYDAEWLALYSCSVLKPDLDKNHPQGPCGACDGKDVFERWGNNFDGLHILLGFQHLAWTWVGNPTFSNQFGRRLRQGMPIWKAWIHTIRNHGPNSDDPDGMVGRGRVIAPYTDQCVTGVYDKIWGNGYVAPDIPPGDIAGWCDIRGG